MLIEHTGRSTEDNQKHISVMVHYGGQQDDSTRKVSIWSANQQCHTTLRTTKRSTQKSTPEKSTLSINGQRKQQQLGQR